MIKVNGVIYRNLEEQVQKNKEDIENLQNQQSGDDTDIEQIDNKLTEVETTLTEITPDVMRALKTPISAPSETKIVAVDSTNSQEMLSVGTGLVIENHQLKSTGGTVIIDNLISSSATSGLSANQGRVLDGKISSLETLVGTKADQSSLNTTNQNVSQNSTKISSLETLVGTKANQSSLDTTNQNVSNLTTNKANKDLSNVNFPTGYIYLSVNNTSPASLFGGMWEQLPSDKALWTTNLNAGNVIDAGLPNITGSFCGGDSDYRSGAFISSEQNGSKVGSGNAQFRTFTFDASASNSIYGSSETVQPPAYTIYAWKKID